MSATKIWKQGIRVTFLGTSSMLIKIGNNRYCLIDYAILKLLMLAIMFIRKINAVGDNSMSYILYKHHKRLSNIYIYIMI